MASSLIQVRVDEEIKKECEEIFYNLGLSMSEAVRLFLKRTVVEQGLPFNMKLKEEIEDNSSNNKEETASSKEEEPFDALSYIYSIGEKKGHIFFFIKIFQFSLFLFPIFKLLFMR